jgi:hypothetical protein
VLDVPCHIEQLQFLTKHILVRHSETYLFKGAYKSPVPASSVHHITTIYFLRSIPIPYLYEVLLLLFSLKWWGEVLLRFENEEKCI